MIKRLELSDPDAIAAREATEKLNELVGQEQDEQVRCKQMSASRAREVSASHESRVATNTIALLAGQELRVITQDDLERSRLKCEVLGAAIIAQKEIVNLAERKMSKRLHALNRSEYLSIQRKILKALDALAATNEAEFNFFDELRHAGCSRIFFRSMSIWEVGRTGDKQSRPALHRRQLKEFLPEALESD